MAELDEDFIKGLDGALSAASRFLLAKQSSDGAWRDFSTEPGIADAWTTAYVGLCLLTLPEPRPDEWLPALEKAAPWLLGQIDRFQGWGYNSSCPPDADSSAHALLFLRYCGIEVPTAAFARLLSFRQPDGGFATYLMPEQASENGESWAVSHSCVTPVALHAMLMCLAPDDPRLATTYDYIRQGQRPDGLWHSFWWQTPLYGTLVNLEAVLQLELDFDRGSLASTLSGLEPKDPFELALFARCCLLLGDGAGAEQAALSLLELQRDDGSWPSKPILRVTRRSCFEPWQDPNPGSLHADQERLFTTATALRSLSEWRATLGDRA